jgi:3-phosphoshikimate 1-carboxyvinyltransferase
MSAPCFQPAGPLRGSLAPPPDKSISHRAAIVAAMGEGETTISGFLDAADARSTLAAIRGLGATVSEGVSDGPTGGKVAHTATNPPTAIDLRVRGLGLRGAAPAVIDVGNAGTLLRLLPGWLAGQPGGEWTLDGDESIRRRPVDRIAEPLRLMGADVTAREDRLAPLSVRGSRLRGIEYRMPVASAQVKSCLLLAGLLADGETAVLETRPTRDHTERMLRAAGARVRCEAAGTPVAIHGELPAQRVIVEPVAALEPGEIVVPGDFSSAGFLCVGAVLVPGSELRIEGVGLNPGRIGLLGVLTRMGAAIEVVETAAAGGEPVGTIVARSGPLEGTRVGAGEVPLAIDELPLVALAGCYAEGETVVSGADELRHKESDRIETVVAGLRALGARIEATEDGFVVRGGGPRRGGGGTRGGRPRDGRGVRGGLLDARGDHRLAMLGAIAGLASDEGVEVRGFEAAAVSYPGFEEVLRALTR